MSETEYWPDQAQGRLWGTTNWLIHWKDAAWQLQHTISRINKIHTRRLKTHLFLFMQISHCYVRMRSVGLELIIGLKSQPCSWQLRSYRPKLLNLAFYFFEGKSFWDQAFCSLFGLPLVNVAEDHLELLILLSPPAKYWDYRSARSYLAVSSSISLRLSFNT